MKSYIALVLLISLAFSMKGFVKDLGNAVVNKVKPAACEVNTSPLPELDKGTTCQCGKETIKKEERETHFCSRSHHTDPKKEAIGSMTDCVIMGQILTVEQRPCKCGEPERWNEYDKKKVPVQNVITTDDDGSTYSGVTDGCREATSDGTLPKQIAQFCPTDKWWDPRCICGSELKCYKNYCWKDGTCSDEVEKVVRRRKQ